MQLTAYSDGGFNMGGGGMTNWFMAKLSQSVCLPPSVRPLLIRAFRWQYIRLTMAVCEPLDIMYVSLTMAVYEHGGGRVHKLVHGQAVSVGLHPTLSRTHTRTHTLTLSNSHTLTLSHSHTLVLSYSHTHTNTLTLSHVTGLHPTVLVFASILPHSRLAAYGRYDGSI